MLNTKAHTAAVYVAFALLTGWLLIGSWQSSQYSPTQYRGATTEERGANHQSVEERHQATEEAIAYYNKWLMFFTAILAIATIGLGVATLGMYSLAREELRSTHRPLIRFRHVWLSGPIQYESPIKGSVTCVNSGTGIAKIEQLGTRFYVLKRGKALPMPSEYAPEGASGDIIPGQAFPLPDTPYTLSENEEIAIRDGDAKLFFVGYVIYRDTADHPRTSSFCRVMPQPGSPEDNGLLAVYNDPNYEFQD
jgi:hypothetical protein